jgi:hypothetical protein
MIYFTLSHFNSSIRDFFLMKGGYTSQVDYELTTDNSLFEIYWNSKTESFEQDVSSVQTFADCEYIHGWVSIHSLSTEVKEYLWMTYLSNHYVNFDVYLMKKNITSTILVYIPIRRTVVSLSKKSYFDDLDDFNDDDNSIDFDTYVGFHKIKTKQQTKPIPEIKPIPVTKPIPETKPTKPTKPETKPIPETKPTKPETVSQQFQFRLNPKTCNSYILFPVDTIDQFKKKYPERFGRNGWNLFDDERVVYYSQTYNGFIVSKKYKNDLLQIGTTMIM